MVQRPFVFERNGFCFVTGMMPGNSAVAAQPAADQPTEIQGTAPVLKRALETNDGL